MSSTWLIIITNNKTNNGFSVKVTFSLVAFALFMMIYGTTSTMMVYASSSSGNSGSGSSTASGGDNNNNPSASTSSGSGPSGSSTHSNSGNSGPSSSGSNSGSSGGGSTAHCDRPGYPSCSSLGSSAGKGAPGSRCPPGHSKAFCNAYNAAAGSSGNQPSSTTPQGGTAHCNVSGYPSCYSLGYADGKNHPGTNCPSGHSANYCDGYRAGAGSQVTAKNNTTSLQADVLHCDQPNWPSCYSVGYQDGKLHPGASCPTGHSADFCSGWNAGAGSTVHCDQSGWPSCYSIGYADGNAHPSITCPSGHTQNYCSGWNAGAGNTTHCDHKGWPSCYDMGYTDGKAHPGTACPPGHSMAYCNGYVTGADNIAIIDTHCDTPGYPSCYSLGYQAGNKAAPGTPCPSGHSLNYCSGWQAGNTGQTSKCNISVNDGSDKTAQNTAIDIKLTEQDNGPCAKPVTTSIVSEPKHGGLKSAGENQFTYTPNTGFNGTDSFQYQASDNNGTKSNIGTVSIIVGSSLHNLKVHVDVAKNPIVRGNNQTIRVTVKDIQGKPIDGAYIQGEVDYASHKTTKFFSGVTDKTGEMNPPYVWRIGGDSIPGEFKVTVDATSTGYDKGSATTTFTVTPDVS